MKITTLGAAFAIAATFTSLKAADAAKVEPYALTTCLYGGEKLGSMGKSPTEVYKGQEMKFCCMDCQKAFD